MGMGEKKQPYTPLHPSIRDDVLGLRFANVLMRECKEPAMMDQYATGGVVNVSIYVCKKCKYARRFKYHGAIGCGYGLE